MSIINQFFKSLYSTKDIARYRFQKLGRSIFYVFLLSILTAIPVVVQLHTLINEEFSQVKEIFQEELPDFTIKDGGLQTDDPTPFIRNRMGFTFAFDPTATELSTSLKSTDSFLAILQNKMVLRVPGQEETILYSTFGSSSLSRDDIAQFLGTMEGMYPVLLALIIIISYVTTCFFKFLTVTFFAFFVPMFGRSSGRSISYKQAWSLMAYILTIPTVFFFITDLLGITFTYSMSLQTFIILFLLFFVIRDIPANKKDR